MTKAATHWDPICGTITVETPDTANIRQSRTIPPIVNRVMLIAAIASMCWVLVDGFLSEEFPVFSVAATTVIWGLFFGAVHLENADGRKTLRRVKLARERDWSYTGKLMEDDREFETVWGDKNAGRQTRLVKSERAEALEALVPELIKTRVGAFVGARFDGEFWGQSQSDGLPLWLAVGSMQMEAGLAFNSDLRKDAYGGKGGFGQFFSLLGAYRINRKTGIRAVIKPENIAKFGINDRDIKTESFAFNAAFHISGRFKDEASKEGDPTLEVLRILTPATQDAMLSMLERYHNIGFVLDDDILFFMAQDKLVGENATQDGIDALIVRIADDFEKAKFGIKRYVE